MLIFLLYIFVASGSFDVPRVRTRIGSQVFSGHQS